jgi:hypothetical protein
MHDSAVLVKDDFAFLCAHAIFRHLSNEIPLTDRREIFAIDCIDEFTEFARNNMNRLPKGGSTDSQGVFQDLEVEGVAEGVGYARSGSAEPGAPSAPAHGAAVLQEGAGAVASPAKGVRGTAPGKFLKFHVQDPAFWRTLGYST